MPSCLGDPAVARARSRGAVRCPVRFLDPRTGATSCGLAAICRAALLAPLKTVCQPRSPSPTSWSLETGIQTIQSSPCAPCLMVSRRAAAPGFDPCPDMLWSRFPFGISAGSSPAPVSRSGMSYANKLSSYEHSFLLRATTAHAHSGDDQEQTCGAGALCGRTLSRASRS